MFEKFGQWYEKNLLLNQIVVTVLFLWQVLHLYWLTTHVVSEKLLGYALFSPNDFYQFLLIVADYFEIPALISGTIFYLYSLNKNNFRKNLVFIMLINSQWLHLFWITDEFVIDRFRDGSTLLPIWLAWMAILIDYLELPVIYDTIKSTSSKLLNRP